MSRCQKTLALLSCVVACSDAEVEFHGHSRIRVSSTAGLTAFVPGPNLSGDTAPAIDLVFESTRDHASVRRTGPRLVTFHLHSPEALPGDEFAAAFACQGARIDAASKDSVTVRFDDESQATYAASGDCGLDLGPYALESESEGRVVLRRRAGRGFERIEIVAGHRSEEWRRLMARQIDIVPRMDGAARVELGELKSIRLVGVRGMSSFGLFFNTRSSPWSDVEVRRSFAAHLDRDAIGRMACGAADCAIREHAMLSPGRLPNSMELMVLEGESIHHTVAVVLRHQLRAADVEVHLVHLPPAEWVEHILAGRFELALAPIPKEATRRAHLFASPERSKGANITGYESVEYDAAFDDSDTAAMESIVIRDVPAIPLFQPQDFAAIDASICGDVEPSATSWRWIADLHPCEP